MDHGPCRQEGFVFRYFFVLVGFMSYLERRGGGGSLKIPAMMMLLASSKDVCSSSIDIMGFGRCLSSVDQLGSALSLSMSVCL